MKEFKKIEKKLKETVRMGDQIRRRQRRKIRFVKEKEEEDRE